MNEYDKEKKDLYWQIAKLEIELKQYKDIEEELGIDLVTLFKALKNGVYCYEDWEGRRHEPLYAIVLYISQCFNDKRFLGIVVNTSKGNKKEYWSNDYGKTWALTREELDKQKKEG